MLTGHRVGSYVWKSSWGPQYHQSIIISICSLVLSTVLGLSKLKHSCLDLLFSSVFCVVVQTFTCCAFLVMRQMLIRENKRMEREERQLMEGPERERTEEAARLEGISFEEAVQRRRGFRYLY